VSFDYKDIDEILSGRLRLAMIAFLLTAKQAEFSELVKATGATKGNLGAQIKKLEDANYIHVDRRKRGKRLVMNLSLTAQGKTAFNAYISNLKLIAVILTAGLIWILWPIYGFLSNQYETARLPWGWQNLPNTVPQSQIVNDADYKFAGQETMRLLLERKDIIAAPSISAAVSVDGHVVWAGSVGWADIRDSKPATPQTTYRIGSTSKVVTATALARLSADNRLNIDAPISDYMIDIPNTEWERFTSRQLASHTAGLTAYEENNDWIGFYHSLALRKRFKNAADSLSVFDGAKTLFKPSQNFHYSGFDNVLLSALMESIVGQSFSNVVEREVFTPLMLTSLSPDHQTNAAHDRAVSYQVKGQTYKPWREVDLSHKLAAGGFVSTPSDLAI